MVAKAHISHSLRTKNEDTILNLEHGNAGSQWGRLIFHVSDFDGFWAYLMEKGFYPDSPQDASWGERYFHMPDPDGHKQAWPLSLGSNLSQLLEAFTFLFWVCRIMIHLIFQSL